MRGANVFTEPLFTVRKLDDFVPADHPLRPTRERVNRVLKRLDGLFQKMYAEDEGGSGRGAAHRAEHLEPPIGGAE